MKNIKYIPGRSNLAITIFVPYNCPNNCEFCTSKQEYLNNSDFSIDKIIKSIERVGNLNYVPDIVITGGEPFSDLDGLQRILDTCKKFKKNIFINTTLPTKNIEVSNNIIKFLNKNKDIINGLNVSRHIGYKTNLEDDDLLKYIYLEIGIPLRINSVLFNMPNEEQVKEFIKKYWYFVNSISFRGDYTKVKDQNDLRGLEHPLLDILFKIKKLNYMSSGGCLVCNNNDFVLYSKGKRTYISLHRGYEHSLVKKENNYIVNDIIIKQNGNILVDWDGELLDVDNIKKQWR